MKKLVLILTLLIPLILPAQTAPGKYWIQFTDKNNSPYSIDEPEAFLSFRAIDRRNRQGILLTEEDLPVNPQYIDSVASLGVPVLNRSKWFNGITIATQDLAVLEQIRSWSFVANIKSVRAGSGQRQIDKTEKIQGTSGLGNSGTDTTYFQYGSAAHQIGMVRGHILHNQGLRGQGMIIAILDGGFSGADTNPAFDSLWGKRQIIDHWDFVRNQPLSFSAHVHGSQVLSVMAANLPGIMVGTAPDAMYILLRTEDGGSEYLIEEDNWVAGAEFADSAGADLINSSLGYTEFDDPSMDHSYEDMDGNTTRITQAADFAASRGLLVVTSASNQGGTDWQYIGAPADGDSVLSIGAVDADGLYAYFSSTGPTFDGRIKPDVAAMGMATALVSSSGTVIYGNGTSYSSPLICGLAACLWQANRNLTNMDIIQIIRQSSSQFQNPDNYLGYGIPDFSQAFFGLMGLDSINTVESNIVNTFPNPFSDHITVDYYTPDPENFDLYIFDAIGKIVFRKSFVPGYLNLNRIKLGGLATLPNGTYLVRIVSPSAEVVSRIIKQSY